MGERHAVNGCFLGLNLQPRYEIRALDPESNSQPFSSRAHALTTELNWSGLGFFVCLVFFCFLFFFLMVATNGL